MNPILIVEDQPMNAEVIERYLQLVGYATITAATGQAGLELAQRAAPWLILMDLGLPDLDGLEVTRRLKADPRTQHIPIIAVTAHAAAADRTAAFAAGCDDYETKPLNFPLLHTKIRLWHKPDGTLAGVAGADRPHLMR